MSSEFANVRFFDTSCNACEVVSSFVEVSIIQMILFLKDSLETDQRKLNAMIGFRTEGIMIAMSTTRGLSDFTIVFLA